MFRKKSTRRKKSSRLSLMFWGLVTMLSGGGVGGYFNPEMPILGPLLNSWRAGEKIDGLEVAEEVIEAYRERSDSPNSDYAGQAPVSTAGAQATLASSQSAARDKLLIATFNIQVFGSSKMAKTDVVQILAQVVRQFDVVAIQEVRAKDDNILPRFIEAINSDGSHYDFIIGPRLGRTVSTEQYAFIFDTTRVEYDPSSVGTMSDPNDVLHREPFAARFKARVSMLQQGFSFWLVNIHTDPDEVPQEISVLADAFQVMQSANPSEDDVILLGDLNASEAQLGRITQIPGIRWVVGGNVMTNTRGNKAYDNIIFQGEKTSEFTGRWGVIDMEKVFGISREKALQVSDHLPVWAEFDTQEAKSGIMAGGLFNRR